MCGSSDAATLYDDGHIYCFSCNAVYNDESIGGDINKEKKHKAKENCRKHVKLIDVEEPNFCSIPARRLTVETCKKYGYHIATLPNGNTVQIADYKNAQGEIVWQKVRDKDKNFMITGDMETLFYGQHMFNGGKKLVITEGEIDCMTVSQLQSNKYPVVSLPNGCKSAKKVFEANIEWLEKFDNVIVMFDMDKPGQEAVESIQGILSPKKLLIATLPLKDPNECLLAGKGSEVIRALWDARQYRPENIINANDVEEEFFTEVDDSTISYDFPWCKNLNAMTNGVHKQEILMLVAGTGIGKSTTMKEISYKLAVVDKCKIGCIFLEESPKKTIREFLSLKVKQPLSLRWGKLSQEEKDFFRPAYEELFGDGKFVMFKHFGSLDIDTIMSTMRHLVVVEHCDFIMLDHITMAVSALDTDKSDNKVVDILMTQMRALVEETGVGMIVISHLRKTDSKSKSFEEGGTISSDDLKGSGALKQLSDTIIALERNQQAEDTVEKNTVTIRVLKTRLAGETGIAGWLTYDKQQHCFVENPDDNNKLPKEGEDF
jgi:twinkle protein